MWLGISVVLAGVAVYSLSKRTSANDSTPTLVSAGYHLDKVYRSMEGPWSVQSGFQLAPRSGPVRTWLTGIDTQIVDAKSEAPVSQEFFCHSNLTFADHSETRDGKTYIDSRLFTLAPGRTSIELPLGFGMPVPANAPLDYLTMSLNLNPRAEPVNVRMRTRLHLVAADQPGAPTKALFRRALYVLQRDNGSGKIAHACNAKGAERQSATDRPDLGCGEWMRVNLPNGSTVLMPSEGMTNHWAVPQGDHVYASDITPQLNLPFDTAIHYATIHVHPFARRMELRDLTAGKTVLHLTSHDWPDRIGVAHVDELKSIDGIPILRGHQYELAVEYNNTSGSSTDAMAILYLYLRDKS
jgi:hypothetical protein